MYSFPSTSQTFAPSACATKNGAPSTLRNARTGEFTPPGIRFSAAAKSCDEWEVILRSNAQCSTSNVQRSILLDVLPTLLTLLSLSVQIDTMSRRLIVHFRA